jgi:ABC-2 type transport system ATP-binding protein
MKKLLELVGVTKQYTNKVILKSLTFTIYEQQAVALIGANGSGKSTLLRMIAGISSPTSGNIAYADNKPKLAIGYVPERFAKLRFTPTEYLTYMGRIQGLSKAYIQQRVPELLRFCQLDQTGSTRINQFSKGMLQKVGILQAILSKPDLLILDEPLSGLDIPAQGELIHLLNNLKQQGMSIIFSSHETELLDHVADRIILLLIGQIGHDKVMSEMELPHVFIEVSGLDAQQIKRITALLGVVHSRELLVGKSCVFKVLSTFSDAILREILAAQGSIISLNAEKHALAQGVGR